MNAIPEGFSIESAFEAQEAKEAARKNLGQADFLRLLTAQLANQDPLNPQDGTEFTAQLATFSSLEQLIGIREGIAELLGGGGPGGAGGAGLSAAALLGKEVMVAGNLVEHKEDGEESLFFALSEDVDRITIEIRRGSEEDGEVVRLIRGRLPDDGGFGNSGNFDLDSISGKIGLNEIEWDGLDNQGLPLEPGIYSFDISTSSLSEEEVADPVMIGRVNAASVAATEPYLRFGEIQVPIDSVIEIRDEEPAP